MVSKYDVFVSYAHVDNEPLLEGGEGWVTTFVRKLKVKLNQEVAGASVKIWMDPRLAGNRPFDVDILKGLDESATLLVFMSKRYAESYWCQREQNTFLAKVANRPRPETRIFIVEKNKLRDNQKFPDEFLTLSRYQFWEQDDLSQRVKTLGEPVPQEEHTEYWSELGRLAQELAEELNELRNPPPPPVGLAVGDSLPKTSMAADGEGIRVFLAEVTDDLRQKHREVKSYLEQYGIEVVPKLPYDRRDYAAYKTAVEHELKSCTLFVQVLSGLAGETSETFPGFPVFQHEIAKSLDIPVFQWRSKELKFEDADSDAQRQLLKLPSVRAEPIDDFKKAVLDAARPKPTPPSRVPTTVAGKSVFVDSDISDWSLADAICESLSRRGIFAFMPIPGNTPNLSVEQITQDFEQSLKECDGLIVVYGQSEVPWVRNRYRLGTKILGQRSPSPPVMALYVAPPPPAPDPKPDPGLRFPQMLPLDCRDQAIQPDENALSQFVAVLRGQSS